MPLWKRNLIVCWFGMFVTGIGMSQIAPILPLFIKHLGIMDTASIAQYSGIAFGVPFIVSAIFSPIWGHAADLYGRKPMLLRASFGMAIIVGATGLVHDVYTLIVLRFLLGAITGYSTACTTLIATQTDQEHAGYALGVLSTSNISGSLIGPIVGGYISEHYGLPEVFFITGILMLIAFLTTALFVQEVFVRQETKAQQAREIWRTIPHQQLSLTIFLTYFVMMTALFSIEPIVTIYVAQLSPHTAHLALLSGIVFSASGLATIIAAPQLGKLSDNIGPHKVMLASLILSGIIFIPQAFVSNPWQLLALRFLLGLSVGGLTPSINTLLKRITPETFTGRVFGFSMSCRIFRSIQRCRPRRTGRRLRRHSVRVSPDERVAIVECRLGVRAYLFKATGDAGRMIKKFYNG